MKELPQAADAMQSQLVDTLLLFARIHELQSEFRAAAEPRELHAAWLAALVSLTGSDRGCSAEVVQGPQGAVGLCVLALERPRAATSLRGLAHERPRAGALETREPEPLVETERGELEQVLRELDPALLDLLAGKEKLQSAACLPASVRSALRIGPDSPALVLPIRRAGAVLGIFAIAGRSEYERRFGRALEPFTTACATLIETQRTERARSEEDRANRQLAHERAVLERLARMDPMESVLEALVRGHEALHPGTLGCVMLLDEQGQHLARCAAPNLPEELVQQLDGIKLGLQGGSCAAAAHTRETVIVADIAGDPRWEALRDVAARCGLGACWSTPILSGQGKPIGTFALYSREPRGPAPHELLAMDSSARLARLAIERSRAEAELRGTAERLALATRSAQMGIFDYDITTGRLVWDERMFAIYGVRREDFRGSYVSWVERVHPEDLRRAEDSLNLAIEELRPFEATFRIIRPDGAVRFIEAATLLQRDARGKAARMTGVNIDVTAKKELESQLLRSQRLESVGRLAGGIAHDLNNLLAPMLIGPSILRDCVQDPEARGLLDTIESSARRAASIIRQLLTFSRGTEGERVPIDCSAIVDDMLQLIRETFPRNIAARREGESSPWPVMGDATQLHQVLMNLCVNARDEMEGGGTLVLRLENRDVDAERARMRPGTQPGRFVEFSVQDDGRGIDPAHMDKLFEPFFTTKGVGRGTGLGLATVLGIVRTHGGFIEVESELGRGTEFRVYLPASPAEVAAERAPEQGELPRGQGELVLIVDDEESIRRVTGSMLERNGYRVLLAATGEEALAIHRERRGELALVLSDLMMPGMDGETLIRKLRAEDGEVRVVVMSGDASVNGHLSPIAPLVQGLLEKPFTMDAILTSLSAALAGE